MRERNTSLDAMKGFAILLVMIGHILILNEINDPYIYPMIEAVQMPVFIMISGYIMGFKAPIESVTEWRSILGKRAVTYIVPFFTWLVLKQWDNLALGIKKTLFQTERGLWFLMTLFLLNVILYTAQLLNGKIQKKYPRFAFASFTIIFGMLSGIFVLQLLLGNSFLSPELTIRYMPPFFAGYFVSVYREQLSALIKEKLQFVGFLLCLALFVYLCIFGDSTLPVLVMQIVKGLLGSYVIFYIFLKSKENVIKSKLAWLGMYTLEVYTVHFHFATRLNPQGVTYDLYSASGLLFVVLTFILMSAASAGLIYMARQTRITNLLLFGRR
ncbi:acyltransferase family protein [Konateibacter massiliensis]|uniref:acyltransferase family protein n=1 Tax=Konateibacter massiliensis TaxID=2002841 RepID=UPI000C15A927|nr:acyltransferase family protein [Konateibacter massiliensis]